MVTRDVPGRVPAGTNGTSRPFCPGVPGRDGTGKMPGQTGQPGHFLKYATNGQKTIIHWFPVERDFSVRPSAKLECLLYLLVYYQTTRTCDF